MRLRPVTVLLACLLCGDALAGQVLPLGPDFQVNTVTTAVQTGPQVARGPGGFVVVWDTHSSSDDRVAGQLLDANGALVGTEFAVSEHHPSLPAGVVVDKKGAFVVAWGAGHIGPGGAHGYTSARRFAADASPLGPQFRVSDTSGEYHETRGIAQVTDGEYAGEFAVVWYSYSGWLQRYSANGEPLGDNVLLHSTQENRIAANRRFGFTITHRDESVLTGRIVTPWMDLDSFPISPNRPRGHRVRANHAGDFVVAWKEERPSLTEAIVARVFAVDGEPIGPEIEVEVLPLGAVNGAPDLAVTDAHEAFIITWSQSGPGDQGTIDHTVWARRFTYQGVPRGARFQVNEIAAGGQYDPAVVISNDDLLFVWTSESSHGTDTDYTSVQARRFRMPVFADGFESGDPCGWSDLSSPMDPGRGSTIAPQGCWCCGVAARR